NLRRREPEVLRLPLVELHRQSAHCDIASPHNVIENRLDRLANLTVGFEFLLVACTALDVADHATSYSAVQPPSTRSEVPVTSAAASDARYTPAPIRSSTAPSRPSLIRRRTSA